MTEPIVSPSQSSNVDHVVSQFFRLVNFSCHDSSSHSSILLQLQYLQTLFPALPQQHIFSQPTSLTVSDVRGLSRLLLVLLIHRTDLSHNLPELEIDRFKNGPEWLLLITAWFDQSLNQGINMDMFGMLCLVICSYILFPHYQTHTMSYTDRYTTSLALLKLAHQIDCDNNSIGVMTAMVCFCG